jgi:hypothetical protein
VADHVPDPGAVVHRDDMAKLYGDVLALAGCGPQIYAAAPSTVDTTSPRKPPTSLPPSSWRS